MATKILTINNLKPLSFKGVAAKLDSEGTALLIPSSAVFPDELKIERFKKVNVHIASKELKKGDILFNTGGFGTLGRSGYFNKQDGVYFPDSFVMVLRFENKAVSSKYIFYAFQTPGIKSQILQKTTGTTGITSIKPKDILSLKIPIPTDSEGDPDIKEQERIVALIEEVEDLKQKRAEADQKMDTVIPALFSQVFGNSSKWPKRKLGDKLATFKYGTSVRCDYDSAKTPVLRIPNILNGNINTGDLKYGEIAQQDKIKLLLKKGDILFVRTNGNPDYVGRCAVFDLSGEYAFASYLIRARLDTNQINPEFLSIYLNTKSGRMSINPAIRTTAGQSNINTEGLGNASIPVPPIELQNEFAKRAKEVLSFKEKQKESAKQIEGLFSSMLSSSFMHI